MVRKGIGYERWMEWLKENPEYEALEEYKGVNVPIFIFHKTCGDKRKRRPADMRNGHGCPNCFFKRLEKDNEHFLEKISNLPNREEYTFLEEYKPNKQKIRVRHNVCGREYEVIPNNFLQGRRCPFCALTRNVSDKEKELRNFIESLGVESYYNVRDIIPPMELDIYIPNKKVAIEFNGTYWHGDIKKSKDYHYQKSKKCEEKGIRLIHIFEYEWDNPRQRPILENIIKHAVGMTEKIIYARKCKIEERESASMKDFFEKNNIQGFRGGQKAVCLVYEGRVVMSYNVGKCFFSKKPAYEIIRGATELGYTVVGGASKLWKYIINKWNDLPILYYIDYNYFNGSSMSSLCGLRYVKTTPSFKNWWEKHWKTGETHIIRNREPMYHKQVIEAQKQGLGWPIYNAGTKTYIYEHNFIKKT